MNGCAAVSWCASSRASAGRTAATTVSQVVVQPGGGLHRRDVLRRRRGGDRELAGGADQRRGRVEERGAGQLRGAGLVGRGGEPVVELGQRQPGGRREPSRPGRAGRVGGDAPGRARGEQAAQGRLVRGAQAVAAEQRDLGAQLAGERDARCRARRCSGR